MKVNFTVSQAVKKLDSTPIKVFTIQSVWHEKIGQVSLNVVVYEQDTQYLVRQEKGGKIYDNYYWTYHDALKLYEFNNSKTVEVK